ncbi:MAG TPA: TMEM175 family protein [bacterium]|nr:TMEM175 family protein [bacterium]
MTKGRLEAFSDGVFAILITIMVLELKTPQGASWEALSNLWPLLLTYLLSFVFLGVYWSNHHHLFHAVQKVNGAVLWANLHLLFWLSLVPFVMAWVGNHGLETWPVAFYGFVQFMAGLGYFILVQALLRHHGRNSALSRALGSDLKGKFSVVVYFAAIPLAFYFPVASYVLFFLVLAVWLVPDRRFERLTA